MCSCQGEGRGSESRLPLRIAKTSLFSAGFFFATLRNLHRCVFPFQRRTLLRGHDLFPSQNKVVFREYRNTLPFFKRRHSPFISWTCKKFCLVDKIERRHSLLNRRLTKFCLLDKAQDDILSWPAHTPSSKLQSRLQLGPMFLAVPQITLAARIRLMV